MRKSVEEADGATKELLEEEQSKAARESAVKQKKEGKNEKDRNRRKKVAEEEERMKKEHEEKGKVKLQVQNRKNAGEIKFQARLAASASQAEGRAEEDETYDDEQAFQRALKASLEDMVPEGDQYGAIEREAGARETGRYGGVGDATVDKSHPKAPRGGGAGGGHFGVGVGGGSEIEDLRTCPVHRAAMEASGQHNRMRQLHHKECEVC
jgi:hypothetical protein